MYKVPSHRVHKLESMMLFLYVVRDQHRKTSSVCHVICVDIVYMHTLYSVVALSSTCAHADDRHTYNLRNEHMPRVPFIKAYNIRHRIPLYLPILQT